MADVPATKTLVPELQFAPYEVDKVKQFNDYVAQAKEIINERLHVSPRPKTLISVFRLAES